MKIVTTKGLAKRLENIGKLLDNTGFECRGDDRSVGCEVAFADEENFAIRAGISAGITMANQLARGNFADATDMEVLKLILLGACTVYGEDVYGGEDK